MDGTVAKTGTQRTAWFTIQLQALRLQDDAEAVEALIQQAEQDDLHVCA